MKKIVTIYFIIFSNSIFGQTIQSSGATIAERFLPLAGYQRQPLKPNSFGYFLRNFALKPNGTKVLYYDGREKPNQVQMAVLDIDRGQQDLQQCADAVMRLRAEYLFAQKRYDAIHFKNFGNTNMDWLRYAQGYRVGNKGYAKIAQADNSGKAFRKYLDMVFMYANTFTLEKEMKAKKIQDLEVGDVFIVSNPNSYGHAMLVVDLAQNPKTQDKIFLLAQSYMPAQDIHIVKNAQVPQNGAWYSLQDLQGALYTPEWTFPLGSLHEFD